MISSNKKHNGEVTKANGNSRYISIDLVESVLMHMNPKDAMRLSTTCKEWRVTIPQYDPTIRKTPWFFTIMRSTNSCILRSVVNEDTSFEIKLPCYSSERIFIDNVLHGWLVIQDVMISLYNPFSRVRLDLPFAPFSSFYSFYMTSAPTNPDCIALGHNSEYLFVWRPGDDFWSVEENVEVKYYKSVVMFKGQLYAIRYSNISSRQFVCFQVAPFQRKDLDVPPPMDLYNNDVYLVESCEELLLVCILQQVSKVHLFRLDLKNKEWIKIESLGDRAIFLNKRYNKNGGVSVSAHETGCLGNCIYLIDWISVYIYDLENHSIKTSDRGLLRYNLMQWIIPTSS